MTKTELGNASKYTSPTKYHVYLEYHVHFVLLNTSSAKQLPSNSSIAQLWTIIIINEICNNAESSLIQIFRFVTQIKYFSNSIKFVQNCSERKQCNIIVAFFFAGFDLEKC